MSSGEPSDVEPAAPAEKARPLDREEIARALRRPQLALDLILTDARRLIRNLETGEQLGSIALILLVTSVAFALPYGGILDPARFWRIVLLYLGSLGICLPSLQVFSAYIGLRNGPLRNLVLGLIVTSVAALFTFGFFPILWFLQATMVSDAKGIGVSHINVLLLLSALFAGIGHLLRCLRWIGELESGALVLFAGWLGLLLFITYRMAKLLDLV